MNVVVDNDRNQNDKSNLNANECKIIGMERLESFCTCQM